LSAQPPAVPPPAAPPPGRPEVATTDDLRAVRRWLLVAGVWAVAATAIAVIALVQANNNDESQKIGARTASQVGRVQRQLTQRLDDIESRLGDLAPTSDVARLDRRLKKAEDDTTKATTKLDKVSGRVDDLETRVDDLETQQNSGTNTDQTNTDATP
jgi:division protein CdvB (Snf7/Vps24/ESCRT-III family)